MDGWLGFEGEVCAVTGALGGMGAEICREFARNGAQVALLDLDAERVAASAGELERDFGVKARGYRMDATSEDEVQAAVDAIVVTSGAWTCWSTPPASCASPPWRTSPSATGRP